MHPSASAGSANFSPSTDLLIAMSFFCVIVTPERAFPPFTSSASFSRSLYFYTDIAVEGFSASQLRTASAGATVVYAADERAETLFPFTATA